MAQFSAISCQLSLGPVALYGMPYGVDSLPPKNTVANLHFFAVLVRLPDDILMKKRLKDYL